MTIEGQPSPTVNPAKPEDRMAKAREAKAAKAEAKKNAPVTAVPTPSKPIEEMNDDEKREYRRQLLEALSDVPNPDVPKNAPPGSLYGEGPVKEKKEFTRQWFEDVEARRKDRDKEGRLLSPDYGIVWFDATTDETIRVNGVGYQVFAGRRCGLPAPHYEVYRNMLTAPVRFREKWAAPKDKPTESGSMAYPHRLNDDGYWHTPEEAAALDKTR